MLNTIYRLMACCLFAMALASCTEETFDYNHPDVSLFVSQLKSGHYEVQTSEGLNPMPKFKTEDIGELLEHADDLSEISSFPLAAVSYSAGGKLRLGHPASMGCKMVHTDAEDYKGIYFLSDEEVLDAVAHYRHWWESRKYPRTMWSIDPCFDEPLCGSGYMWW